MGGNGQTFVLDNLFGKNRQVMNPDRSETESHAGSANHQKINQQDSERKGVTEELRETFGGNGLAPSTSGIDMKSDNGNEQELKISDHEKESKQKKGFSPFTNKKTSDHMIVPSNNTPSQNYQQGFDAN